MSQSQPHCDQNPVAGAHSGGGEPCAVGTAGQLQPRQRGCDGGVPFRSRQPTRHASHQQRTQRQVEPRSCRGGGLAGAPCISPAGCAHFSKTRDTAEAKNSIKQTTMKLCTSKHHAGGSGNSSMIRCKDDVATFAPLKNQTLAKTLHRAAS